ncbi:putative N-acetylglucosamine-6-phosphate deacetylase [Dictyocaulus viviparus]|uniref:Putative N-acetylglucosamine-6-phosphate deacetylase n=1 Tax=Dictyocaulus viviparus TaxID=29172 RepID=A0A0D8XW44_DICVI|nr:putative N-acetylglucosamine-6-phosphate deacetylase [Dictyocaulus viviparus]
MQRVNYDSPILQDDLSDKLIQFVNAKVLKNGKLVWDHVWITTMQRVNYDSPILQDDLSDKLIQFVNAKVLKNGKLVWDHVWVRNGKIIDGATVFFDERRRADIQVNCKGLILCPGFIDLQINGAFGIDFSSLPSSDEEYVRGIQIVSQKLLQYGVTSYAPTIISSAPEVYSRVLPLLARRSGSEYGAGVLGAHVEGPFISSDKKGCHPKQHIREFGDEVVNSIEEAIPLFFSNEIFTQGAHVEGPFISSDKKGCHPKQHIREFGDEVVNSIEEVVYGNTKNIAIVTLAPELTGSESAIRLVSTIICTTTANQFFFRYFCDRGIVVSLGHSNAGMEAGERGISMGAQCITHLFNAMQSYHHRDPALIGLLTSRSLGSRVLYFGIISDGIHTHDSALKIAYNRLVNFSSHMLSQRTYFFRTNPDGLILITDAMAALGMGDGRHYLGDCVINVTGLHAILEGTNTTAGSVASMAHCIAHFVKAVKCSLEEALICATEKPVMASEAAVPEVSQPPNDAAIVAAEPDSMNDGRALVSSSVRSGDVISPSRAVLTLSKSMFNAGCFSLPYAWKLGGLWVSFFLSFVIAGFNWYGNHILVRASQHLAKKSERSALDYGHFAKKVCDYSDIRFLRNNSKAVMYAVNITILFYQLGMCSVAILFISDNMVNLLGDYLGCSHHANGHHGIDCIGIYYGNEHVYRNACSVGVRIIIISVFYHWHNSNHAVHCKVFLAYIALKQPNQWRHLPASTNFTGTIMMIGMSMYSFEGQTMILPVENKLESPEMFLAPNGVLPTTMIICTCFMTALGFYGYTAFGDNIAPAITTNVPKNGLYSTVNVFLMLQSMLGHSIAMYVVFDMFFNGYRRKFSARFPNCPKFLVDKGFRVFWVMVTFLMAILIPRLEIMIPLVGVTSGTLCALVYPPIFEMITFWTDWKGLLTYRERLCKITLNIFVICVGFFAIFAGLDLILMPLMFQNAKSIITFGISAAAVFGAADMVFSTTVFMNFSQLDLLC